MYCAMEMKYCLVSMSKVPVCCILSTKSSMDLGFIIDIIGMSNFNNVC